MTPAPRVAAVLPRAEQLLADGVSYNEAARTLGVAPSTLSRYLPGRSSWTVRDGGVFVAACRALRCGVRIPLMTGGVA